MKSMRRFHIPTAQYFVTIATNQRQPFLLDHLDLFRYGWGDRHPEAWVVMQDHFHAIVYPYPFEISRLIQSFKLRYTRQYFKKFGKAVLWQNRFWDHMIRNQSDFRAHLDYIHYNPVHHGICSNPFDYQYSTIGDWLDKGAYQTDWGRVIEDYSSWHVGEPFLPEDVG